jgi:hypothetical protein
MIHKVVETPAIKRMRLEVPINLADGSFGAHPSVIKYAEHVVINGYLLAKASS